ncbi:MAG: acetyltransferase [Rhodobacteraceae bacterium HLUCCA12]|nr:MAG: acetyltransferase [Rhodobacteraceae bacterium HLUCCA12]
MYRHAPTPPKPGRNAPGTPARRSDGMAGQGRVPDGQGLFDPVQIAWLAPGVVDDLDPANADLLAPGETSYADPLGERGVTLRPWHPADAQAMRGLLDDRALWTHLPEPFPEPMDLDTAQQMIAAANGGDHHVVRAVCADGRPVGQVRLAYGHTAEAVAEAEISYWLGRDAWGKGLGRALVAAAADRAFANAPGLLRLVAKVRPDNTASRRCLEAAGFAPIAPPEPDQFPDWAWFGLRRQDARQRHA